MQGQPVRDLWLQVVIDKGAAVLCQKTRGVIQGLEEDIRRDYGTGGTFRGQRRDRGRDDSLPDEIFLGLRVALFAGVHRGRRALPASAAYFLPRSRSFTQTW